MPEATHLRSMKEIVAVISSASIVGLATGFSIPLVSLRLSEGGASTSTIGFMAAMPALGMLVIAPFVAVLSRRYSIKSLLLLVILGSALSILFLGITQNLVAWIILRFMMGLCAGTLVVLGETWINYIAQDSSRGRLVAVYTTTFTICQVVGPSLLAFIGSTGWLPLIVISFFHLWVFLLLSRAKCDISMPESKSHVGILGFVGRAPVIAIAVLLFSFFDNAILSLMPLYGLQYGYAEKIAVLMVSIVFVGDALLQIPLGWMADKYGHGRVHFVCGVVLLCFFCLLPLLMKMPIFLWPALIILGASAGGVYTIGLVRIGDHFKGQSLVNANASIGLVWGIGSLLGPVAGSTAINVIGPNGLVFTFVLLTLVFLFSSTRQIVSEPSFHEKTETAET